MELVLIKKIVFGAALALATPALFAQVAPISQFVTPKAYRTLPQNVRENYVAGVIDGESAYLPQIFAVIRPCVKGSDLATLTAAVDNFMKSQPDDGNSMPLNVHNAVLGTCKKPQ